MTASSSSPDRRHEEAQRLANAIRDAKAESGMSQREIAKRVGVDQTMVSSWVRGAATPSLHRLMALEQALSLPPGTILARAGLIDKSQTHGRGGNETPKEQQRAPSPSSLAPGLSATPRALDTSEVLRWPAGEIFDHQRLLEALTQHQVAAASWSSRIHLYGMSSPRSVAEATLPLGLAEIPRRFRDSRQQSSGHLTARLNEDDLIADDSNYVILGDPGSGKTTTLKRLVWRMQHPDSSQLWQTHDPLIAVLREHVKTASVARIVLQQLGLLTEALAILGVGEHKIDVSSQTSDDLEHQLVAAILNHFHTVLLLDGLDEVSPPLQRDVIFSVLRLSRLLTNSKIIITTRSGQYGGGLENFATVEIAPLEPSQSRDLVELWLGTTAESFWDELNQSPAREFADRPLLLAQLILLYRNWGKIPDQPSSVYRQVIRLFLQDWDEQRAVRRPSRYASMDVEGKLDFLAEVAYLLTRRTVEAGFDHELLVEVCGPICRRFGISPGEAEIVVRELESHTGIIVESGYGYFTFAHEAIREYLAAHYLVRVPDGSVARAALAASPAPVAVAVALSSDPSRFLSSLLSNDKVALEPSIAEIFALRLLMERPRFAVGPSLGVAMARLLRMLKQPSAQLSEQLLAYPGVMESVADLESSSSQHEN